MARPSGPKTRCGERWTEARFRSFIVSTLRSASRKWAPIQDALKNARVARGEYLCAGCGEDVPLTFRDDDGKKVKNAVVDHIEPVVDPTTGFTTWDDFIERMFVEEDGLQVLCYKCHKEKTDKEKALAAERRNSEDDS